MNAAHFTIDELLPLLERTKPFADSQLLKASDGA